MVRGPLVDPRLHCRRGVQRSAIALVAIGVRVPDRRDRASTVEVIAVWSALLHPLVEERVVGAVEHLSVGGQQRLSACDPRVDIGSPWAGLSGGIASDLVED